MPEFDLSNMKFRELKDLQREVARAIDSYEERRRKEALAALEARARDFGFSVGELTGTKARRTRSAGAAKYSNPDNLNDTWSGKGRKPRWFLDAIAAGRTPEDLLLK